MLARRGRPLQTQHEASFDAEFILPQRLVNFWVALASNVRIAPEFGLEDKYHLSVQFLEECGGSCRDMKGNSGVRKYLILYNSVEAALWAAVWFRLIFVGQVSNYREAHDQVSPFLLWVQTSAILEVVHVALGLVPSPLFTTIMQVASRLLLVWGIDYTFPHITANSGAFVSMVTAWSITEVLRYSYYAINLQGTVPDSIMWLRYTLFYVLYPLGAGSECWLVYQSLDEAVKINPLYKWALVGILITYIPGFYFLYTYMIAQRRKMFKRQGKKVVKQ